MPYVHAADPRYPNVRRTPCQSDFNGLVLRRPAKIRKSTVAKMSYRTWCNTHSDVMDRFVVWYDLFLQVCHELGQSRYDCDAPIDYYFYQSAELDWERYTPLKYAKIVAAAWSKMPRERQVVIRDANPD